jgi:hypothetical protein
VNADEVLDAVAHSRRDHSTGVDAMRWVPDPTTVCVLCPRDAAHRCPTCGTNWCSWCVLWPSGARRDPWHRSVAGTPAHPLQPLPMTTKSRP